MKVKEIYENALALSISRIEDEKELDFYAVKLFNILLAECRLHNDQLRVKKGKQPLEAPQVIAQMDGEVDMEWELYAALSYGFAAKLLAAQEDTGLSSLYNNQYVTLLNMETPAVEVEVE